MTAEDLLNKTYRLSKEPFTREDMITFAKLYDNQKQVSDEDIEVLIEDIYERAHKELDYEDFAEWMRDKLTNK